MLKTAPRLASASLLALAAVVFAGCDQKAPAPGPRFQTAQKAYTDAQGLERARSYDKSAQFYRSALAQADLLIRDLVPGDEFLAKTQKLREDSAAGIARVKEALRREQAATGVAPEKPGDDRFPTKNLLPPVVAYVAPAKEPDKPDPEKTEPGKDPADPKTEPKTEPKKEPEPKPEPVKPKTVRVTKVLIKKSGTTIVIYWTFTNLTKDNVRVGAPMGYATTAGGQRLATFRQHFLAKNFELNSDDPLSSRGTAVTPDSVRLGPGGTRDLITVGTVSKPTVLKQAGGGKVVVRMSDGSEPTDLLGSIERE